jgi:hypothetical protein
LGKYPSIVLQGVSAPFPKLIVQSDDGLVGSHHDGHPLGREHPPDLPTRSPLTRQSERAKVAKFIRKKQKQNCLISEETQAAFFALVPIARSVVLLAPYVGARQ